MSHGGADTNGLNTEDGDIIVRTTVEIEQVGVVLCNGPRKLVENPYRSKSVNSHSPSPSNSFSRPRLYRLPGRWCLPVPRPRGRRPQRLSAPVSERHLYLILMPV
ncbi:MAG: hypothetical protein J07HX64_02903 [halophilic archaeon J07HX64]|nr:MAG: hypothetical protein J07HX64_02903 [halophilic archaeon J07HX64]